MKRIISFLLVFILLAGLCPFSALAEENYVRVSLQSVQGRIGETVTIPVLLEKNPGIVSLRFSVAYSSEVELIAVEDCGLLKGWTPPSPTIESPYYLRWSAPLATENNTKTGQIALLTFRIKENADPDDYATVWLSSEGGNDAYDANGNGYELYSDQWYIRYDYYKPVTGISLLGESTVPLGSEVPFGYTTSPADATNQEVLWSSSDPTVATVDQKGRVTGKKIGQATITVQAKDGGYTDHIVIAVKCIHAKEQYHPYTPSTCTTQGHDDYWSCIDCGAITLGSDKKLPLNNNHQSTIYPASPSSCTVQGHGEYQKCDLCGVVTMGSDQKLPLAEHRYVNNICLNCGDVKKVPMQFKDVKQNAWYYNSVEYVFSTGLMNGTGDGSTFEPNTPTSRAMLVTILYRLNGSPSVNYASTFSDVKNGKWYTFAVLWAQENGIVTGYGNGKFGPNDQVTREQVATILYRFAQYAASNHNETEYFNKKLSVKADLRHFSDHKKIGGWAKDALSWANGAGIITGRSDTLIAPKEKASRAEIATMLQRYQTFMALPYA